jgi:hypothetical protein
MHPSGTCEGDLAMKLALFRGVAFLFVAAAGASAAVAEHPRLLKRHGVVYGVSELDSFLNCKGTEPLDQCVPYVLTGFVESMEYYGKTPQISGFVIRTKGGVKLTQSVLPWDLPREAYGLIRPGRLLRIRGTFMGTSQSGNASEIIAVTGRSSRTGLCVLIRVHPPLCRRS